MTCTNASMREMNADNNLKKINNIQIQLLEVRQRVCLNIDVLLSHWVLLQERDVKHDFLESTISDLIQEQYTCLEGLNITLEKLKPAYGSAKKNNDRE